MYLLKHPIKLLRTCKIYRPFDIRVTSLSTEHEREVVMKAIPSNIPLLLRFRRANTCKLSLTDFRKGIICKAILYNEVNSAQNSRLHLLVCNRL